ncbi:MAG: RecX family transcriptional regulator [Bacteroidales bacterium]|nr:RecX family transcriptional regulator [Bacteroidales bacterium]
MTENEALSRLQKICSQQEKCLFDINRKLTDWKIPVNQAAHILEKLKNDNFIDEIRYSKSFVKDKFRFNEWGKIRLAYTLRQKKIDERIIQDALAEIDETEYISSVIKLLEKKRKTLKDRNKNILKAKLIKFLQSKGFEFSVIQQALYTILKEEGRK